VNFPFNGLNLENDLLIAQGEQDDDEQQEVQQANEQNKTPSVIQSEVAP